MRRRAVEHGRPNGATEWRSIQDQEEQAKDNEGKDETEDVDPCDVKTEHWEAGRLIPASQLDIVRRKEIAERALDAEGEGIGDQHGQRLAIHLQWTDEDELDHDPKDKHRRHGHQQGEERVDMKRAEQCKAEVGTEDDQRAVAHVDDPHDPKDERETGGHQGVDTARQDAKYYRLQDQLHYEDAVAGRGRRSMLTVPDLGV